MKKRKICWLCLFVLALFFKSHFIFAEENESPQAYACGISCFFGGVKSAEAEDTSSHSSPDSRPRSSAKADSKGFSITPFFQEVNLEQNQKEAVFFLTVENTTDAPATFRISVLDFGALDESGGVAFLGAGNPERKYGLASWISLEKDALVLNPGDKQNIRVAVENKESLSPGGHYAAIFLKMENDKTPSGDNYSAVAFNPSFASLIFARKIGGETYGLELKGQELQKQILRNPSGTKLRFQNTGNTYVIPRGIVKITDPLGREVLRGIINYGSAIILPETFRVFPVSLKKTALVIFPGRYTLSVEYRYDGKDDFAIQKFKFNFIPASFAAVILIAIGFLAGYAWYKKRKK